MEKTKGVPPSSVLTSHHKSYGLVLSPHVIEYRLFMKWAVGGDPLADRM